MLFTPKAATSQTERMATLPGRASGTGQPTVPRVMPAVTTARIGEACDALRQQPEP